MPAMGLTTRPMRRIPTTRRGRTKAARDDPEMETGKTWPPLPAGMLLPLQESVNVGAINAAGWAVGLGSLALVVIWLNHLYR
jgi:hypothetical protein